MHVYMQTCKSPHNPVWYIELYIFAIYVYTHVIMTTYIHTNAHALEADHPELAGYLRIN